MGKSTRVATTTLAAAHVRRAIWKKSARSGDTVCIYALATSTLVARPCQTVADCRVHRLQLGTAEPPLPIASGMVCEGHTADRARLPWPRSAVSAALALSKSSFSCSEMVPRDWQSSSGKPFFRVGLPNPPSRGNSQKGACTGRNDLELSQKVYLEVWPQVASTPPITLRPRPRRRCRPSRQLRVSYA
jgi:hypothetical protein